MKSIRYVLMLIACATFFIFTIPSVHADTYGENMDTGGDVTIYGDATFNSGESAVIYDGSENRERDVTISDYDDEDNVVTMFDNVTGQEIVVQLGDE